MSRTPMYDPLTSDARSSWLAGLTEACNKLSGVLDMKVQTFTNLTLPELYIEENDRFRIYQAPLGNKLWLTEPAPVIKKNGTVITPENDGFTIDYLGGSIAFEDSRILTEWDVITADASYIVDESNKISSILASIDTIEEEAGKNKGAFNNASDLEGAYPNASSGDFAIVSSENAIYIWDDTAKEWVNANAKVDLTSYFTKTEINAMLDEKQDTILAKEIPSGSSESSTDYFYAGNKTWVNLIAKIKGCALSGLVTNDESHVEEADTLLEAIGKLQAQINSFIHPIVGNSAPTSSTVGVVGQDYINKSNGDKYRLISIEGSGASKTYIWQKYGATSVTNFTINILSSAWSNKSCTISNSNIQSGTEYTYFVGPSDSSYKDYNESGIYADDITTNGSITFHASETPTVSISVDICKMSGSTNGGKVYNVGGGGGSNKNAVTVDGGANMEISSILGSAPYEIKIDQKRGNKIIKWVLSTLPSSANWQSVTYGDGKFVAVAYNSNKSAYSTDGITWAESTMPSSANWQSVAYGDGKFVAVAYISNKSAYSEDGINWTESTLPSSGNWQSVAYGDGKFVAVAYNNNKCCYTNNEPVFLNINGIEVGINEPGAPGKSAYEYAVDGGYTGTEAEFQAIMASGPFLPLNGGTMEGALGLGGNDISAIKKLMFSDIPGSMTFEKTGFRCSEEGGLILMKGNNTSNYGSLTVADPTDLSHSATKRYVDNSIKQAITDSWSAEY